MKSDRDSSLQAGMDDSVARPADTPAAPVLDLERALDHLDGDRELWIEIARAFIDYLPVQIEQSVEADDTSRTEQYAHSLKGSAANIGATQLRELTGQIESAARENDRSLASKLVGTLRPIVQSLRSEIQSVTGRFGSRDS